MDTITNRYEILELKKFTNIGMSLLYILPPVGVAILGLIGLYRVVETIRTRQPIPLNAATLFFVIVALSTFGAALTLEKIDYFIYPVLFAAYFGVYHFIYYELKPQDFVIYRRIAILGGLYIVVFGKLHQLSYEFFGSQPWLIEILTGAHLVGFNEHTRLFGSAYNPNFAAYLLLLAIGFCFMELLAFIRKKRYFAASGTVLMAITLGMGVLATGSRSGFAAMAILLFIFLIKINWRLAFVPLSLVLIFPQSIIFIIPRSNMIWHALQVRFAIWQNSFEIWMDHPRFGVTPSGFERFYLEMTGDNVAHAHNVFLSMFAEYGVMGGLAFVFLVAVTLKTMIKFLLKPQNKRWLDAFIFTLPIVVLTGIFDNPLFSPQLALPTIMLFGVWDQYVERCHAASKTKAGLRLKKQPDTKRVAS